MGDEIATHHFTQDDFAAFEARLVAETGLVRKLFTDSGFSQRGAVAGFELEAWLIDKAGRPAPINKQFLDVLQSALVVPELAAFNVELNGSPSAMTGRVFTRLHDELGATWADCCDCAQSLGHGLVAIGILPTVTEDLLDARYMSPMVRYRALNDQIMALRNGAALEVNIDGHEPLSMIRSDVMLEAAATSFQVHLQTKPAMAARAFNATLVASAPMVAVSANSPFLFGHSLWEETRIPLFEQAVHLGSKYPQRVGFGAGYIAQSLLETFEENLEAHPIVLPALRDDPPDRYPHVRFHNGTIWRWNRPLLGFDFDGQPHLRIEHRVVPAGPSLTDCIANAAFYFGLVRAFVDLNQPIESLIDFGTARSNFYEAARHGLRARIRWLDGEELTAQRLILDQLLPRAETALGDFGIPLDEIQRYLNVIRRRAENQQTGAAWQRRWVARHGRELDKLTLAYAEAQQSDEPVHTWSI
jgi:hypothetical protein